jgi:hypothetical protein
MVQEQPPRRSKAAKQPVTIDLTAEGSQVVSEPVRSNDSDEPTTQDATVDKATPDSPKADDVKKAEIDQTGDDAYAAADALPEASPASPAEETLPHSSAEMPPEQTPPVDAAAQTDKSPVDAETPSEARSDWKPEAATSYDPEPAAPAASGQRATEPKRTKTSPSALMASGIVGGIVALALAGSMQYAGYLPAVSADNRDDNSTVAADIDALRQEMQALQQRPAGDPALAGRIQALEQAQEQAQQQAQNAGPSEETQQRLAALDSQLQELRSTTEATASTNAELTRRLGEAETRLNDRGPEEKMARAVAAAALKAAIDRGGSFEPELQTFANVAGDDPAAAQLKEFAAVGVPSRAQLQQDYAPVADAMLEAATQPDPAQGLAARLFSSAISVVKVRQVGQVEGSTPEAVVARIENALRSGDLTAAAREWEALPEPAKAKGQDFKRKLDARVQVETLVDGTLTRAVAGTQD